MAEINLPIFSVEGVIYDEFNAPLSNVIVKAFDKDLRREQLLGEVSTNNKGQYFIKYTSAKFARAEKSSADICLKVFSKSRPRVRLKKLGESSIFFNVTPKFTLDFKVDGTVFSGISEFDSLKNHIVPLLRGQRVQTVDLTEQDIDFLSHETEIDASIITLLSLAAKHIKSLESFKNKIAIDVYYGLLRLQFPRKLNEFFLVQSDSIEKGIKEAVKNNIISKKWEKELPSIIKDFNRLSMSFVFDSKDDDNVAFQTMIASSIPTKKLRKEFVDNYFSFEANPEKMWDELALRTGFEDGKIIESTQKVMQLNLLSGHPVLAAQLHKQQKNDASLSDVRAYAKFTAKDFERHITDAEKTGMMKAFLNSIEGNTKKQKIKNHAIVLEETVEKLFPTDVFRHQLSADNKNLFNHSTNDLVTFLGNNPDFDLKTTKIHNLFEDASFRGIRNTNRIKDDLTKINRINKLAHNYKNTRAIINAGMDSAVRVVAKSEKEFVKAVRKDMPTDEAKLTYRQAVSTNNRSMAMVTGIKSNEDNRVYAINGSISPDYQSIFGTDNNLCNCEHCQSVYSPSAYFVDMLSFIKEHNEGAFDKLAKSGVGRRSDLTHVLLTCNNTNRVLPYIDLVNEVLESQIEFGSPKAFQTTLTTAELSAFPEHVSTEVYETTLAGDFSSFNLPFNLPLKETRIYLDKLGCQRYQLMEMFYGKRAESKYSDINIAAEYLGLSSQELANINGTQVLDVSNLDEVESYLALTGLSYIELLQVLECKFVNPIIDSNNNRTILIGVATDILEDDNATPIVIDETSCNVKFLRLKGLTLELLQNHLRFIRLWKKLDWDVLDLDRALIALNNQMENSITDTLLVAVSNLVRLKATFRLSISQLISFWKDLPKQLYIDYSTEERTVIPSLYHRLFQNKTISNPLDEGFSDPLNLVGSLSDKSEIIAAALNIDANDFDLLTEKLILNNELSLTTLTILHQHTVLAKILNINITELLLVLNITGFEPFTSDTANTLEFIDIFYSIKRSGFSLLELASLVNADTSSLPALDVNATTAVLTALREGLQGIEQLKFPEAENDIDETQQRQLAAQQLIIDSLSSAFNADASIIEVMLTGMVSFTADNQLPAITPFIASEFVKSIDIIVSVDNSNEAIWLQPDLVDSYFLLNKTWNRLSLLLDTLSISADEFIYLQHNEAAFDMAGIWNVSVENTTNEQFERLIHLITLIQFRDNLIQPAEDWYLLFESVLNPNPSRTDFDASFESLTGISTETQSFLTSANKINLQQFPDNFIKGKNLLMILACNNKAISLGSTVETLFTLADITIFSLAGIDSTARAKTASTTARNLLKARYDDKTWLDIIKPISNQLRSDKRDALLSYLLNSAEIEGFRADNKIAHSNDVYAHFLIDSEMAPCMMTSRIKQAISSVQLFIDRCLMGLEEDIVFNEDFVKQWNEWRKVYRVWEANRKVFLHPENWIEPELRDDKSPFFKELESKLTQNEVTDEVAKDALLEYLEKLDTVANLEIIAFFDNTVTKITHVVGRTKNIPHQYFYRQQESSIWTAWEKVELDIQGDHILLVEWNNRLMVFWAEFTEKQEQSDEGVSLNVSKNTVENGGEITASNSSEKHLEMKLNWSEQKNGRWEAKKISKRPFILKYELGFSLTNKQELFLISSITSDRLDIHLFGSTYRCDYIKRSASKNVMFSLVNPFAGQINNDFFEGAGAFLPDPEDNDLDKICYDFNKLDLIGSFYFNNCNDVPKIYISSEFLKMKTGYNFNASPLKTNKLEGTVLQFPFLSSNKKELFKIFRTGLFRSAFGPQPEMVVFNQNPKDFQLLANHHDISRLKAAFFYANSQNSFYVKIHSSFRETIQQQDVILNNTGMYYSFNRGATDFNSNKIEFIIFYHPFSCNYIEVLNSEGIKALYREGIQNKTDTELFTSTNYDPNIDLVKSPYPVERVDFSISGTYSLYNWELFYHIPLLIASRLSQNQKFEEARKWFHYIFDPTQSSQSAAEGVERFWITKPFKQEIENGLKTIEELLNDEDNENDLSLQLDNWQSNPFNPHAVARLRKSAYMRSTLMKYIDNLIDWADQLFRRDSIESINEATQLYILATNLLGEKPASIPVRDKPESILAHDKPEEATFDNIKEKLDPFSHAKELMESFLPLFESSENISSGSPVLMPLFCLPQNKKLLAYWDNIADKLFKIRHCMNIEGVVRQPPLFELAIDPALLVRAKAAGLDLNTVLNDIQSTLPHYRFQVILQKANELCNDVKSLGSQLLASLEKKDAEELSLLRSGQEVKLLELIRDIKKRQIDEAKENLDALNCSKQVIEERKNYYSSRPFKNDKESFYLESLKDAALYQNFQGANEILASVLFATPDVTIGAWSWGATTGGAHLAGASKSLSASLGALSNFEMTQGNIANVEAGNLRRQDDWAFQADTATLELKQIAKQILAAEIRLAINEKDLSNHEVQMEQTQKVRDFMQSKFSNADLYDHMVKQISGLYFQTYQMAYDYAKQAEKCYQFELGIQKSNIIKFGHWDNLKQGLLAGEHLQFDLRRLESSFLTENKRELELSKHISLRLLSPLALITLRETGKCTLTIPEELFDLDYPGHYFRRIKSVSISLPCVAGPYTTIACSLSLVKNSIRIEHTDSDYKKVDQEDGRFKDNRIQSSSIATSTAQNDSGVFELNFRDERYLPFEGAGVISDWEINLFNDESVDDFGKALRQFDYDTISDAIIHIKYTAKDGGATFKGKALEHLTTVFNKEKPSQLILSLKHDFSSEWYKMLNPSNSVDGNILGFKLSSNLFSFRDQLHKIKINSIKAFMKTSVSDDYELSVSVHNTVSFSSIPKSEGIGEIQLFTKNVSIELELEKENPWQLKILSRSNQNLEKNEIEDMYLLLDYVWGE